ncbi:hypothetical protein P691DRAFT_808396 [Macrolepiota fuliginosa MF-IS2]|uniref:Uncharacterized protein n=1 Tax=Macrolepiota fuliginosa MF-IS2 TaxID=1400762 RepID=A0A9P5XK50_9AGAR|nr:hypothetical protein P691DRAFT_808396 [Macrolepiota fuliginosa MF-IS2]
MGNSASRAARKLPKRAEPPAWAGKGTPRPGQAPAGLSREQIGDKLASEHRTEAIEEDARDPDFLANLQRLGPVTVDHHMKPIRTETTASSTSELFKARREDAEEREKHREYVAKYRPAPKGEDRFFADQLSVMLDARKGIENLDMAGRISKDHEIDVNKLESVARFITTPSIMKGAARKFVDKDGNDRTIAKAVWVDAPYDKSASTSSR